ncbi:MAG TPA: sensor histidine kinase [Nocardioides sp.]|nr:sensor histidine kinase [Nocardioides sp.]
MRTPADLPLYWRVVLTNGLVFALGTLALAFFPATVSERVLASEAVVLGLGLVVILATNALLLRRSVAPLDRLAQRMREVDAPSAGRRLPEERSGPAADLVSAFNAMLDRLEAERTGSSARALAAQEDERRRIATELHDEIGQSLTTVLLALRRVADRVPPGLADEVDAAQESVRTAMTGVRDVASRLRPVVLEDLGLLSALASLTTETARVSDIHVVRSFAPGLPALEPDVELVVYRVAQEALTNVSRHARARTAELSLTRRGNRVVLRVADDGRGIKNAHEGSGIAGMRERARLVDADLEVRPAENGGTEVELVVPFAGGVRGR